MRKRSNNNFSFSAIPSSRQQGLPQSFSKVLPSNSRRRSQISTTSQGKRKMKQSEKSFSESQSSEASCIEKKFYRCGCMNHNRGGCGHTYQNYLAQLRDKRLRKKASLLLKQRQSQNNEQTISFQEQEGFGSIPLSSAKGSKLLKIMEQSEQAEYSKSKTDYSISITVGKHFYFRNLKSKEQFLACMTQIQQMIAGKS